MFVCCAEPVLIRFTTRQPTCLSISYTSFVTSMAFETCCFVTVFVVDCTQGPGSMLEASSRSCVWYCGCVYRSVLVCVVCAGGIYSIVYLASEKPQTCCCQQVDLSSACLCKHYILVYGQALFSWISLFQNSWPLSRKEQWGWWIVFLCSLCFCLAELLISCCVTSPKAWELGHIRLPSFSMFQWLSKQWCGDTNFSVNKLISSVNKALSWKPVCAVCSHAWLDSCVIRALCCG